MKKLLTMIFAGALIGALGAGCGDKVNEPSPEDLCWVIVNTTQGEETLLLAKRAGSDFRDLPVLLTEFKASYGAENIKCDAYTPESPVRRDKTAYCYEISATVELSENYHPPVEALLKYSWWSVVKYIDERTITDKIYRWCYTEEAAEQYVSSQNKQYQDFHEGKIISSSIKNLDTYVENRSIEF